MSSSSHLPSGQNNSLAKLVYLRWHVLILFSILLQLRCIKIIIFIFIIHDVLFVPKMTLRGRDFVLPCNILQTEAQIYCFAEGHRHWI